ncbi:hypothetical protein PM082_015686 [Marasmius tenuissimus]|nr:hypothetical protein PM082_015686 [Marasmius tenuissimus]
MDPDTISTTISSALEAMEGIVFAYSSKTSRKQISLRDPSLESQVKSFTEQVIQKLTNPEPSAKPRKRPHAHGQKELLIHLHENDLLLHVEPCFGASKVACGNCIAMVAAYVTAYPDSPLIDLGWSSQKFDPDFGLDWDVFVPQMRRDFVSILQEEIGEQLTGWMNHQEQLTRKPCRLGGRVWTLAQYVAEFYYHETVVVLRYVKRVMSFVVVTFLLVYNTKPLEIVPESPNPITLGR